MAQEWDTREIAESAQTRAPWIRAPWIRTPRTRSSQGSNGHNAPNGSEALARSLGWFSIGLGLAEIFAPRSIAKIAGTRNHTTWIRAFGVREVISGIGILTNPKPAPWVWSRVSGDIVDLAALGTALASPRNDRSKTALSVAAVAGVTALDLLAARNATADRDATSALTNRLEASVIVNRSPAECYRVWRNFEDLPRFMSYLRSVRSTGDGRSHWVAVGPGNATIEWDAEIVNDVPDTSISWRSLAGGGICTSGSVEFAAAPGGRGTIVRVQMDFSSPPDAVLSVTKILGKHPSQMVYKDLRRFKQVVEIGEVITTEGQPAGRTGGSTWLDSLAR